MIDVCPCCGNPMPGDGVLGALTPAQRKVFSVIKSAGQVGITALAVMDRVYANSATGGPDGNVVSVLVNGMNRRLEHFGLRVVGKRGPGGFYVLRTLEQIDAANG